MNAQTPIKIEGVNESIYAGFWIRFGSLLLDFLLVLPVGILVLFLNGISKNVYYMTILPFLAFHFWYGIYLVQKNGGTPGKLIAGIKVLKIDGTDVTWREAILRDIVSFALTVFLSLITINALVDADTEYYENLNWMTKQKYLMALTPALFTIHSWVTNIWSLSELVVLLMNERNRALHDFMADTVVVKIQYIDKMREVMHSQGNK